MATKKTASSAKKSAAPKKAPATKVTTVKAVSAKTSNKPASKLFGLKLGRSPLLGASLAEFVGTFLLTAVILVSQGQPVAIMFAVIGIVLLVGTMSGAHINPAITVGAWATRKVAGVRAISYIAAQLLGAMLAFVTLSTFYNAVPEATGQAALLQGTPEIFKAASIPADKEWVVFFAEVLGTLILGFSVASALRNKERVGAALTVGTGIFIALLVAGTGTQLIAASSIINPAVALSLQAINFVTIWPFAVYVFGAALGGMLGFILNDLLSVESDGGRD